MPEGPRRFQRSERRPAPGPAAGAVRRATSRRCRICCTGAPAPGPVRERRPVYVDLLPPCNAGCPAGREHPGLAGARQGGPTRAGVARSWSPTIRCRRSTGGSATTRARASATAPTSTAPSRSTRSSGSWATSRWSRGGSSTRRRSAAASGCSWSAPGRAGCRPPTTWPGSATRSRSATRARSRAG